MFSLEVAWPPERRDLLIAEIWEQHPAGILELDSCRLRVFFADDADREALVVRFHALSWRQEQERDWVTLSRAGWEPLLVGQRFFLVPEWRSEETPPGRFRIVVNPGLAFGTGLHETTQLCIEALESWVRPGMPVLDVGTGSGILAQAATLLGASPVWACDTDAGAVQVASCHAMLHLFVGSADAVRTASAGLIVANISPEAIALLSGELMRCLRPGGSAVVSGFEKTEIATVKAKLAQQRGVVNEIREKGSWALLAVTREP